METQAQALLQKYYPPTSNAYGIIWPHSCQVAALAERICQRLELAEATISFVRQAALLHDIGILATDSPQFYCYGQLPYICHGIKGRHILEAEGWWPHALVAERHIGVGLSLEDIQRQQLPLPHRDMQPQSLPEEIITYADLFFSKSKPAQGARLADSIEAKLAKRDYRQQHQFQQWRQRFGEPHDTDL